MSICLRYVSKFSSLILEGGPCLQIKSFFLFGFLFFCLFVFLPVVCITVLATESIRGFFALLFFRIGGQPSYRLSVFTLEFVFCIRRQNNRSFPRVVGWTPFQNDMHYMETENSVDFSVFCMFNVV